MLAIVAPICPLRIIETTFPLFDETNFSIQHFQTIIKAPGPCRRLRAASPGRAQPQVRFRGEADIDRLARLAGSVENDPTRTCAGVRPA
jgi:hypothetical protein